MEKQECTWIFVGDEARRFNIRMMHGLKNGEFLLYCNNQLLCFDEKVFGTAKYSFFLEDELCEVQLDRQGDFFHYSFHINKKAKTMRNKARSAQDKVHQRQMFYFFGILVLLVVAGLFAARYMDKLKYQRDGEAFRKMANATSTVTLHTSDGGQTYTYTYPTGEQETVSQTLDKSKYILPENLHDGASYKIYFIAQSPKSCWIDFAVEE